MYDVLDVCRYVINYSDEKDYGISNLKLQKILYFIQAYFLMEKESPCFQEKIEAWDFGPVIPKAYREYKQYASSNIPKIASFIKSPSIKFEGDEIIWKEDRIPYQDNIIIESDKRLIQKVVDNFSGYSATDLVIITHKQDPWKNAYVKGETNEITIESIKGYFNEYGIKVKVNPSSIYWKG